MIVGGCFFVIFIYGGGFIVGIVDMEMLLCIVVVKVYDCICISFEYRLLLEVKFFVVYNDCWDVIVWVRYEICFMMKSILIMNIVVEECSVSMGSRFVEGFYFWWSVCWRVYFYIIVL